MNNLLPKSQLPQLTVSTQVQRKDHLCLSKNKSRRKWKNTSSDWYEEYVKVTVKNMLCSACCSNKVNVKFIHRQSGTYIVVRCDWQPRKWWLSVFTNWPRIEMSIFTKEFGDYAPYIRVLQKRCLTLPPQHLCATSAWATWQAVWQKFLTLSTQCQWTSILQPRILLWTHPSGGKWENKIRRERFSQI